MGEEDEIHSNFGWPKDISVIDVISTLDGTNQPTLHYSPPTRNVDGELIVTKRPLLVALHTWSFDYRQNGGQIVFAKWCIEQGWHFLHPNFRGSNTKPEACGSDIAIQDILDAIQHVVKQQQQQQQNATNSCVDEDRIYVVGVSGGGHMALLLASRYPKLWAGVSAWCGISDLAEWWKERSAAVVVNSDCPDHASFQKYARNIESVLGGVPDGVDISVMEECRNRSPVTYLSTLSPCHVNLDINHGISDGREGGSVPFRHSLQAFDSLLPLQDRRGEQWMRSFYELGRVPPLLVPNSETEDNVETCTTITDPLYQGRAIHYRRTIASTRITIFEGGHEILHTAALNWLAQQRRGRPSVWEIPSEDIHTMNNIDSTLTQAGK